MEQIIKPKSLRSFVTGISGLFINKGNENGITPKECLVISCILHTLLKNNLKVITRQVKVEVANDLNQSLQVTTNYISKLRKKGVVLDNDTLHSLFYKTKITIQPEYDTTRL